MYELEYVKKRKRKKLLAIFAVVGAAGVTGLSIVSFLGRFVGTFTVSLNDDAVKLSLSEDQAFSNPTSFLRLSTMPPYEETTVDHLPPDDELDTEETDYLYGANLDPETNKYVSMSFLKYTFYVKNVGDKLARYHLALKITKNEPDPNDPKQRTLDDTLRVKFYENTPGDGKHASEVYAKEAAEYNYDKNGVKTRKEFVSDCTYDNTEDENHPLAETFLSSALITERSVDKFYKGDMKRYTVVAWLEGNDPQSRDDEEAPIGAKLELGVEINAYENTQL